MALQFDVGLDPATQDLPINPIHINGTDLVIQRVTLRLQRFLGEWILDTSVGLPYLAWVQQKPPDVQGISAILQAEIATTSGVARVDDFTGEFIFQTRTLRFTGLVRLENEEALTSDILVPIPAVGNSTPAVVMFQRSGSIAR